MKGIEMQIQRKCLCGKRIFISQEQSFLFPSTLFTFWGLNHFSFVLSFHKMFHIDILICIMCFCTHRAQHTGMLTIRNVCAAVVCVHTSANLWAQRLNAALYAYVCAHIHFILHTAPVYTVYTLWLHPFFGFCHVRRCIYRGGWEDLSTPYENLWLSDNATYGKLHFHFMFSIHTTFKHLCESSLCINCSWTLLLRHCAGRTCCQCR